MVTLIDLPFEMLERIATFTIAAERVPRMRRSILRLRLIHLAFGPPFLRALFQDFDCRVGPAPYVDKDPLDLLQMKSIASDKSLTRLTKKLSLTTTADVTLDRISGFPRLYHPAPTGTRPGWQCNAPTEHFCLLNLTTFALDCFNAAKQDKVFGMLSASCPNLQQVNITTVHYNRPYGTEPAVVIPFPSMSMGITPVMWTCGALHRDLLRRFLRDSALRPVELAVAPFLISDAKKLYENDQHQEAVTRLLVESPVLARVTELHLLSAFPLPANDGNPALRSCLLQLASSCARRVAHRRGCSDARVVRIRGRRRQPHPENRNTTGREARDASQMRSTVKDGGTDKEDGGMNGRHVTYTYKAKDQAGCTNAR